MRATSRRRRRGVAGALVLGLAVSLAAPAARAQETLDGLFGLQDVLGDRIKISGYLDFTNLLRIEDFQEDPFFAANRLAFQLETEIDLLGPEKNRFLDQAKFFTIVRPRYDFVYQIEDDIFGDSAEPGGPYDMFISAFGDNALVRPRFEDSVFPLEVPYDPDFKVRGADRCLNCNFDEDQLAWGDTDSFHEYPLKEAYLDLKKGDLSVRLGKQLVVWGKTDFFRLQDVINPIDFGLHSFLDGLEDIYIPQWMLDTIYKFHDIGPLRDVSLELVWNFDEFNPLGLGQAGEPWANLFGEEIKAFARFYDLFGFGIQTQDLPGRSFDAGSFGGRLEFLLGPVRFSLSDYYTYQQLPIFKLVQRFSAANPNPLLIGSGLETCCGVIHLKYPRVNYIGASADYFEELTQTVWRIETSYTVNEQFVNTRRTDWVDESDVIRWAIGIDRITFLRFLNPTRSFFLSGQIFATHILNHEGGQSGYINWGNDFTATFFFLTNYMQDRLNPSGFVAYQFKAGALAIGASVEYLFTDHLSARIGANYLDGRRHTFDNQPFQVFAAGDTSTENFFGPVREGFGTDRDRDEFYFAVRYRF